jgi:beta-mannosidase
MGEPHLYTITWELLRGSQIAEKGHRRIGLRTIELVQDRDSIGQSFYFNINGLPVFIKGANYIPQESFLPRVPDSVYETLLEAARKAHMNMLRIWGGGIYEKELFYDLCDEKGILVWQDFMFACALFPGDSAFFNNVAAEVSDQVIRLRNHPCLALWCGNNEVDEGWKNWGWQRQYKYSPADSAAVYHDYLALFDSLIPAVLDRHDPWRPYIASSPLHGWGRSLSMKEGDSHYWGVWWGKEPFEVYERKTGRFMSEYGFQGFPDYKTLEKVTLPEDRQLGSAVMKSHQKHPTGFETIDEYLLRNY